MSVIVISCGKNKAATAREARDLYTSSTFRLARAAAERDGRPWLILSAKHGLLDPETIIEPYDEHAKTNKAAAILGRRLLDQGRTPGVAEVWTSSTYALAMRHAGWSITEPLAGLQIGQRRHWFKEHAR